MLNMFKSGDIVQLKSGGPKMTVDWIEQDGDSYQAKCDWFNAKNELMSSVFNASTLVIAN